MEALDRVGIPRHQGRANELGELENRQFFWMIAQGSGLVKDFGTFAFGLLQQMGSVKEFTVERWVFSHHDRAETRQGYA